MVFHLYRLQHWLQIIGDMERCLRFRLDLVNCDALCNLDQSQPGRKVNVEHALNLVSKTRLTICG